MKNCLIVYKKSLYQIYFLEHRRDLARTHNRFSPAEREILAASHQAHLNTLELVREELNRRGIRHRSIYRARQADFSPYRFVITVGGDGTFLEASRHLDDQAILGVNSDPERSSGFFCATTGPGFAALLDRVLAGEVKPQRLSRMAIRLDGEPLPGYTVNEVLAAHRYSAGMSCYTLRINGDAENQRGSGVWVSTAAGSSGAILSAGGKRMPLGSRRFQYLPREPYEPGDVHYRLRGGIVRLEEPIIITSRMREGMVFIDGCHYRLPFPHGARLELEAAPQPLRAIVLPE